MKKNIIVVTLVLVAVFSTFIVLNKKGKVSCPASFTFLTNLVDTNGGYLGLLCAKKIDEKYFSEIIVLNKDKDIIYRIDKSGMFNQEGMDAKVGSGGLYGFDLVYAPEDNFSVSFYYKDNDYTTEGMYVKWNYDKKVFSIPEEL